MAVRTQPAEKAKKPQRISTIKRQYPDQWVVVEVTRISRVNQPLAGRVLAHGKDRTDITRETKKARDEQPEAILSAFYTGPLIPEGMTVIFGCG